MEFVLAQVLGVIALIILSIGYFVKDRFKFLLIQVIANFFYASAFVVIGTYVAGVITFISLARCLYLFLAEKYSFKYTYYFLPVFIVGYILSTIFLWNSWLDIIPLITSITFTFAFTIKNLQLCRYILIIPNTLLIVYNILATTYASALLDLIEVIVIVVAIIKYYVDKKKETNQCEKEEVKND